MSVNSTLFSVHSRCCISFCWQYFTNVFDQTHQSMQLFHVVQVECHLFWLIMRTTFLLKTWIHSPILNIATGNDVFCPDYQLFPGEILHPIQSTFGGTYKKVWTKIHTQTCRLIKKARFNEFRRSWYDLIALASAKSSIVPADEYDNNGWRFAWFFLMVFFFIMCNVVGLQEVCQKLMNIRLLWDVF